jgi:hypothetical protein
MSLIWSFNCIIYNKLCVRLNTWIHFIKPGRKLKSDWIHIMSEFICSFNVRTTSILNTKTLMSTSYLSAITWRPISWKGTSMRDGRTTWPRYIVRWHTNRQKSMGLFLKFEEHNGLDKWYWWGNQNCMELTGPGATVYKKIPHGSQLRPPR